MIVVGRASEEQAVALANRLSRRLEEVEIELAGTISVSIGIAHGPEHAANPRELVALRRGGDDDGEGSRKEPGRPLRRAGERAARRAGTAAGGRSLDRAHEAAPVARRQAEPAERRPRDRDGDRERAARPDRLPQLPHLPPRRRRSALRSPSRAISPARDGAALDILAAKVGDGFTGWVAEHGESLLLPDAAQVRVRRRDRGHRPRSRSR